MIRTTAHTPDAMHSVFIFLCVVFPPSKRTGQLAKNARNNKTSLSKYLIPREATLNNERLPRSLWNPAIPSWSWESLKKPPYLGGVCGPQKVSVIFLSMYVHTLFREGGSYFSSDSAEGLPPFQS